MKQQEYQEALDYLVSNGTHTTEYSWEDEIEVETERGEESVNLLQKLVDKETPMKPIKLGDNKFSCKSCAMAFTVKNLKNRFLSHNYCHVCGQRIDWSEEE